MVSHPANTNTPVAPSSCAPASFAPAAFTASSILLPPTPSTYHPSPPVSSLSPAVPPVSSVTFTLPSPPPVFNDPFIYASPNSSISATLSSHSSTVSPSKNPPQSVLKRKKASRSPSNEVGGCLDAISKRDEELHFLRKKLEDTKLIVEESNLELSHLHIELAKRKLESHEVQQADELACLNIELAKRKLESYEVQQANEEAHHGEVLSLVVSMRQLVTSVFGRCHRSDNL